MTVEYFKSFGDATEPDQNIEIVNCFRIGYRDPGDAMRAVRKNGEILGGSWMIGAKWAVCIVSFCMPCLTSVQDPLQAESILGQPLLRHNVSEPKTPSANAMTVDEPPLSMSPFASNTPTVGTPIKLAPSSSVFRKPGSGVTEKTTTPQQPNMNTAFTGSVNVGQASPSKGVLGQVSDLIFGW